MSLKDRWGNPVSTSDRAAVEGLETAMLMLAGYQIDPVAAIDAVLAKQPDLAMGHAFRAGMLATSADKAFEPEMRKSVEAAEKLAARANERERGHIAAVRAWLDGEFERAVECWGRVAVDHPLDLAAVQFSHLGDFLLGYSHMLRDRIARVLPHWTSDIDGRGFVLGMHAFGLEESGAYGAAEEEGHRALALNAKDGWAVHAITHVMEMQGRAGEGAGFLRGTAAGWTENNGFAFHNWWHLGLFELERGDLAAVMALYDEKISGGGFGQALELVDGTAMLWRLSVLGHDVGARWQMQAEKWAERIEDGYYAFNDLHAMASFVGADRRDLQQRCVQTVARAAAGDGTNAMMCREIGLPAVRGLEAFGRAAYVEAIQHLLPLRGKANRFGGSHAQRDIFSWTLTEAAIRTGDQALAQALVAERLAAKPDSPINLAWAKRAQKAIRRNAA